MTPPLTVEGVAAASAPTLAESVDPPDSGLTPDPSSAAGTTPAGESASSEQRIGEIVVVDDSPTMARLLELGLRNAGFNVHVAGDGAAGLELALRVRPDLVLADVGMPVMDGLELTRRLRTNPLTAGTTVILVTARGDSSAKLEAFDAGADDYVVKPFDLDELLARVNGALRRASVLRGQSPLTRLPGNGAIQDAIERCVRARADFALMYCDLDNFKAYNDKYGFLDGDRVLKTTAEILQETAFEHGGAGAFVGHIGGDDFVVMTELGCEAATADEIVRRFDLAIRDAYDAEDVSRGFIVTVNRQGVVVKHPIVAISIGIASTRQRTFEHYADAVSVATEMKAFMKKTPGSSWAIDRRTADRTDPTPG